MKTKIEIENKWRDWVRDTSMKYRMPHWRKMQLMDVISKEVQWIISIPDSLDHLLTRLHKYQNMLASESINISDYDKFFSYRIEFFQWILN